MELIKPANYLRELDKPVPTFEEVLLQLAVAVGGGVEPLVLVNDFCRLARETFGLDGVYCWRREAGGVAGMAAEGINAARFLEIQIKDETPSAVMQAINTREAVLYNDVDAESPFRSSEQVPAVSYLLIPVVVAGEVTGAVAFVHCSKKNYFTEQIRTRASILTAQLGGLIETARLSRSAREQRRRADAMIESASALYTRLDTQSARDGLTHRLLSALEADLVALLENREGTYDVAAIAYKGEQTPLLGDASSLARFAAASLGTSGRDYPLILDLDKDGITLPMATSGQVLVLPMNVHAGTCQVVIYGGEDRTFAEQDIALARAICGVGALAIQNSQLFTTTSNQAVELKQLLEISSELGTVSDLDQFLKRFVLRAAEFLGFRRSFIAMVEPDGVCRVRYVSSTGEILPLVIELPSKFLKRILFDRKVFFTEDASREPEADRDFLKEFHISQILSAPLFGADGKALGVFGVLDRLEGDSIRAEDGERALALAGQVAAVLESTRNLHMAEEHRRRAENLMSLALEISTSIRLPELVTSMTRRAMDMLGGRAAALALMRSGAMETVFVQSTRTHTDKAITRRLNTALTEIVAQNTEPILEGEAAQLLTPSLAEALGWENLTMARLVGADGELVGVLCIVNRQSKLEGIDRNVLQALAGHASVALDNSRLFMRIAQANSQWVEIFDAISDFIIVHDQNNRVLRVNRSMADFIGGRPAELIGVDMRALMALAQDMGPDPCPFCRTGKEASQDEFLHPVLERVYLVSSSRIRGSLEEGIQTIHVLKDITDRREAERRYRELFDNIQEGLFFSSPEGRFIEVNDALVRMLGYSNRDELLKTNIERDLYVDPKERGRFCEAMNSQGVLRNYEEVLRRKDGTLIHTLQNAFAVRDGQDNIIQYRGLMLDISEVKAFQSELQHQRDFNDKILNNTQSLILVSDTAGLIAYANQRCYAIGGYRPGELVGRKLSSLVAEPKRDAFETALAQTLIGQQIDNLELPITMAQGHIGQYSVNLSPMRDDQGQVASIVAVMSDISDVAILQAKLTQTEKMAAVGQLVSGVAHEVNNPLTAILGFADLLSGQEDMPETARVDLNIIIQEAQRTKQIVQNLLSFARQSPPQHEPLQINEVLRRTLQLRAYDFSSHGIEVMEKYDEKLPQLIGDTHQLQQVFLNVLNNAYDAVRETGRQGKIEVSTSARDGNVEIVFADNGPGIKYPERIFDPFYTTKEVGKGTGLGLSICYGIIREHGGEILASNRKDDTGAVFTLRIPVETGKTKALKSAGGTN
jgi:PAS domain S-box-containing protein